MQSDWNSFSGDIVLESVNIASMDEDIVLNQIFEKFIFLDLYYEDLNF